MQLVHKFKACDVGKQNFNLNVFEVDSKRRLLEHLPKAVTRAEQPDMAHQKPMYDHTQTTKTNF